MVRKTAEVLGSVVVVGGSIAAVTAAETLRVEGFDGQLTIVSEERHQPYSRVPLSKGVLAGHLPLASVALPAIGADIVLRTGARAADLSTDCRHVILADGEHIPFDGLVVATGGRARRIGTPGQTGELVLRSRDDAGRLADAVAGARDVVVVGGGVLGMEIASTCRALGLDVTVVDRDPPLVGLLGPWLADLVVAAARDRGIRFVTEKGGVSLIGTEHIEAVRLGERQMGADVVVSACGDLPNTEWLASSGLAPGGVLTVDSSARVAPGIVAAGDVAARRGPNGAARRNPVWMNAVQQGAVAARALLRPAEDLEAAPNPYFWTEHPGLELKISGTCHSSVPRKSLQVRSRSAASCCGGATRQAATLPSQSITACRWLLSSGSEPVPPLIASRSGSDRRANRVCSGTPGSA